MSRNSRIFAVATMDTKGQELAYVADRIRAAGAAVVTVDVGTQADPTVAADVSRLQVAACHPGGENAVLRHDDRGRAVTAMGEALEQFLLREHAAGKVAGVIGIGGSGGTALIAPAMRALPVGMPKVLVSTVASGNTAPYVGATDITMMYSVVDVAGLNRVSKEVLANAAHAIAGMVMHPHGADDTAPAVGLTMFGVTTPCVTAARRLLEERGFDCLVFHATGTGGRAMEKLVASDLIHGVLDITTTEVADEVVGGVFAAGPARFDVILEKQVPYVMSVGALDMVNFGAKETVPPEFRGRKLHVHNANVTLMRTTPDENRRFAEWIAVKVSRSTAPLTLLIPEGGVSALDAPGQPFYDPEADRALFDGLENSVVQTRTRRIVRLPHHINDAAFAEAVVKAFLELQPATRRPPQ
jgi:uncharacterized protein (UPF0261 family)